MPACMNPPRLCLCMSEQAGHSKEFDSYADICAGHRAATKASDRAVAYARAGTWTANSLHNGRGDVR